MVAPRASARKTPAARLKSSYRPGSISPRFDCEDAREAGEIRAVLEASGQPIGPYDTLIAAQARRRRATLATLNVREFERVPGLRVEDWDG